MYHASAPLRAAMLFACGGKITPAMASRKASLEEHGGFIRDRFITEAELRDFYASADVIWCVYAPDYDQASGILGRAMQLGLPVVVRKGSLIHRLCADEGVAHVALDDATDVADIIALASRKDPAKGAARALSHRAQSLRRLNDALGVGASSNFACAPGTPQ